MSQLETNPLINPTTVIKKPNQVIQTLPTETFNDFSTNNPFMRHISPFGNPQTNWVAIAATEKYLDTLTWMATDSKIIKSIEIKWSIIKSLMPIGLDFNSYVNFDTLIFTIKKTDQPFYQGALVPFFDPAPQSAFYKTFYDYDLTLSHIFQFNISFLSPKNSGDVVFAIPINIPFEFLKNGVTSDLENWINDYSFGRLGFYVMDTLATQATTKQLKYPIRVSLVNAATSGLNIK